MPRKLFWIAASCIPALLALLPVFSSGSSPVAKEKVIYSFTGGTDGGIPLSDLTLDGAGNLYGTTEVGGKPGCQIGCGTVFEMKRTANGWREEVLYSFTGGNDGGEPGAGVIFDNSGNLYGTTPATVFKLTPNSHGGWTFSVIYTFNCSGSAGCDTLADLVSDAHGNLYGTTASGAGGPCNTTYSGCGAVFELTPQSDGSWTETTLHVFGGAPSDGAAPVAAVLLDSAGNVYGTTKYGGNGLCSGYISGCGTVYKLTRSGGTWTETVLHNFVHGGGLGLYPAGQLFFDGANHLLGVTQAGGDGLGTFFELEDTQKSGWQQNQAHIFFGSPDDGQVPAGRLVADSHGNLLGVTTKGGAKGDGLVFELEHRVDGWKERVLYSFTNMPDGAWPAAGLVSDAQGHLFGTTQFAGGGGMGCNGNGCGTVYEVTP
jgi:hypothetical protein